MRVVDENGKVQESEEDWYRQVRPATGGFIELTRIPDGSGIPHTTARRLSSIFNHRAGSVSGDDGIGLAVKHLAGND